jgi:hypothetical protein
MTSMSARTAVVASARSYAPASLDSTATAAPALRRDRAFTAFASSILGALGAAASASDAAASGASSDATGGRVNDVALGLKNALENWSGPGDAVDSLLGTVQAALDQASQALGAAGYGSAAIQSFVTQFRGALSERLDVLASQAAAAPAAVTAPAASVRAPASPAAATQAAPAAPVAPVALAEKATTAASSGAFTASYRLTESGAIELVTTEGDVVRIGFRSSEGGAATGASATGAAGLAAYAAVSSYASSRFSVSVQGSLNADELKAVNDVLGQINTLATQFFSGSVAQAFASAATLSIDPKEIASVALRLTESVGLRLASVGDGTAPPVADAANAAAATTAATPATATSVPAAAAADTAPAVTATAPPTFAGGGLSSLLDYLRQLLDALGTTTTQGTVTFTAKAKVELLGNAVAGATIAAPESAAAAFLKRILASTTDGASTSPAAAATSPPAAANAA